MISEKFFNLQRFATYSNARNFATVSGSEGDDTILSGGVGVKIFAYGGNDKITNRGNSALIEAAGGNDTIYNDGNTTRILAGAGDDSIFSHADYVTILAGEGNDSINAYGTSVTISGNEGNDIIKLGYDSYYLSSNGVYFGYTYGDGKDTIYDFDFDDDSLILTASANYTTLQSGQDIHIKFDNNNSITFINPHIDDIARLDKNITEINNATHETVRGFYYSESGDVGRRKFYYSGKRSSSGSEVTTDFKSGNNESSDVIVITAASRLSNVKRSGKNVSLIMSNGNSIKLQTNSSSSEAIIQYSADGNNIFGAKIGASDTKSLNYDNAVTYFQLGGNGTLNVTGSGQNNVWLDGSQGKSFSGINNIKATGNGQNILAGNSANNSIVSGSGNSSLWGGAGNNSDTLIGGNGTDMFWYGKNDGEDIINNASSSDVVNLYDVRLQDITAATTFGKKTSLTFNTGKHLQINSTENLSPTFKLADGSWKFNHSSRQWRSA